MILIFLLCVTSSLARNVEVSSTNVSDDTVVESCIDVCECLTPLVREFQFEGAISFQVYGNRFNLQKQLALSNKPQCNESINVEADSVYLECQKMHLKCVTNQLMATFSTEYTGTLQLPGMYTVDFMYCTVKDDGLTKCHYHNATKYSDVLNAVVDLPTFQCNYEKPRKYCLTNFTHHKGLCVMNFTVSTYVDAKRMCGENGAELLGNSKRDWAHVDQSPLAKERIWFNQENTSSVIDCASAINYNGTAVNISYTDCDVQRPGFCSKKARKKFICHKTPLSEFTTQDMLTQLDDITTDMETTTQSTTMKTTQQSSSEAIPSSNDEMQLQKDLDQVQTKLAAYLNEINVEVPVLDLYSNEPGEKAGKLMDSLDSLIERLAISVTESSRPTKPLVIETETLVIKVIPFGGNTSMDDLGGGIKTESFTLQLPESLMQDGVTLVLSAANFNDNPLPVTMAEENQDNEVTSGRVSEVYIASLVATLSLRSKTDDNLGSNLKEPLQISFTTSQRPQSVTSEGKLIPSCRFWKPIGESGNGVWSKDGCKVKSSNDTHTQCECVHLTSFAVLMSVTQSEITSKNNVIELMTLIGCSLSIICLGSMILIFIAQKLFRADRNLIHMNLAFTLMIAQLMFIIVIEKTEHELVCKFIGMGLHFFFLGSFFWMLNEGIYLVSKTRSKNSNFLKMPTFVAIGWGCPFIVVGVTAAVSFDSYGTEKQCWLRVDNGGIWAFVGPAMAIVLANMIMLCNVIRVFLSLRTNMKKKQVERTWLALRAMLITLPLLGLTWLFGLLTAINSTTVVFEYLFVIFNSLQGVFIFILYCILNDEVRKSVKKNVYRLGFMSKSSAGRTSKTTI